MFNIFYYSGEKMISKSNNHYTVNDVFQFLNKVDDLGEIHLAKTPATVSNAFNMPLREAIELFHAWVDISAIDKKFVQ